jgi:hypothetical protein
MLDLKQLAKELIKEGWHCGGLETEADNAILGAIDHRDWELANRKISLVNWLNRHKAFMGFSNDSRGAIADQILAYADERREKSLNLDCVNVVAEFNKLKDRIAQSRLVTSLHSRRRHCGAAIQMTCRSSIEMPHMPSR